jgi:hypothetical protein
LLGGYYAARGKKFKLNGAKFKISSATRRVFSFQFSEKVRVASASPNRRRRFCAKGFPACVAGG